MWSAGAFFVATLLASLVATGLLIRLLRHHLVLDRPTGRSSHATPTLRGAGLVVVPVALIGWAATLAFDGLSATGAELAPVIGGSSIMGIVSWYDDRRDLAPLWRLGAHAAVIGAVIYWLPQPMQWPSQSLGGAMPNWVVLTAFAVLLLWFVNAFNFMDGIDGIAGVEAAAIGLGVLVLAGFGAAPERLGIWGAALAGAAIGFLWWNWQPAKIFLGDVGSIPLGLLSGWLLLRLAMEGAWAAALILPAYYLADATLTLLRRAARGEKVWRAHREHFYQRAVQAGRNHAQVSLWVAAVNVVLIGLAVLSIDRPLMALAGAALVVGLFLFILSRGEAKAA